MRSAGETKSGEPDRVTRPTNSMIAVLAGPSRQDASVDWATAGAAAAQSHRATIVAWAAARHFERRPSSIVWCAVVSIAPDHVGIAESAQSTFGPHRAAAVTGA